MYHDALFKAIRMIGSRKKTAKLLGVSIKIINNWFTRDRKIRVEHALMLEVITDNIAKKQAKQKIMAEQFAPHAAYQINAFRKMLHQTTPLNNNINTF
jgi:DNA-binding transcriptional regulator YdaS (Cro superfamily)